MKQLIIQGTMILGVALILFSGCTTDPNADIKDITLELDFKRVDMSLHQAATYLREGHQGEFMQAYEQFLKPDKDFLYYFAQVDQMEKRRGPASPALQDTMIAFQLGNFLSDSITFQLLDTLQQVFPQDYDFTSRITPIFKRYHLYFPTIDLPAVRTHVNGYDPEGIPDLVDQTMSAGPYYSLGLHYFMGNKFPYYSPNLPQYIRNRFDPNYLEVIVANDLAEGTVAPLSRSQPPTLLNKMIAAGIKLYVVDNIIPHVPDSMKLFYSTKEMLWADYYERDIYKELAPRMYTTDYADHKKYLDESSYTSGLSNTSAPRIAQYCGWKIVTAYMEKNSDISLVELCHSRDYEKILTESRYKP